MRLVPGNEPRVRDAGGSREQRGVRAKLGRREGHRHRLDRLDKALDKAHV